MVAILQMVEPINIDLIINRRNIPNAINFGVQLGHQLKIKQIIGFVYSTRENENEMKRGKFSKACKIVNLRL
jgi:hypothetical protein